MVIESSGWTQGTVQIAGGHLGYHRTGGGGAQLVLVHGLTDNGLCWSRVAAVLADEFDIIMLDARGHGTSSRQTEDARHDPAQDLAEAITGLGLKSPILIGHSVGAWAAAAYAGRHPEAVSKLILEDPPLLPVAEPFEVLARQERFRQQITHLQSLSDAELAAWGRALSPTWHEDEFPEWMLGKRQVDFAAMPNFSEPWQSIFASLSSPTLLIYGDVTKGGLITPEIAAEAVRINPQINAVQIEAAGHNIRRENFQGFLAAVRAFLDGDSCMPSKGAARQDTHGKRGI